MRLDPSSPASVAGATFSTARKGFDTGEVRTALTAVSQELDRLNARVRQLEGELALAKRNSVPAADLDEAIITEKVGEETARVLQTARVAASEIRTRAEENAARIVAEASDEVARLRQDADAELARKRADAAADAEAEVTLAKQQGREMVNEARAYRERVLADLEARTGKARQQLEELAHGRERLLQVFERARLVAVDVSAELSRHPGPAELVNLANTTGPVPVMVPAERPIADLATEPEPEPDAEATEAADEPDTEQVAADATVDSAETAATEPEPDPEAPEPTAAPESGDGGEGSGDNVVRLFPDRPEPAADAKAEVDDLFARLREAGTGDTSDESETDSSDDEPPATPADSPFARRDEALVPLIVAAAKKLKRVLADEQNGVLDVLSGKAPVTSLDALVADPAAHAAIYAKAIDEDLTAAARAGAAEAGGKPGKRALDRAIELLASGLVGSLRERLGRSVAAGAGDNADITRGVRNVYREWKTQHIDDALDDVFRFAYAGGLAGALAAGTPVAWTVDPAHPACADCEDNSLAADVVAGGEFPTGHTAAPAHPGCHCLVLPA